MADNITSIGFDIPGFDKEKKQIIQGYVEIYEAARKISDTLIPIGSKGGFTELIRQTEAAAKSMIDLQNANIKAAQSIANKTKATTDDTKADLASEKAKQSVLKTEQEVIKTIAAEEKAEQQRLKTKKEALTFEQAIAKEKARGLSQAAAEEKIANQLTDEYGLLSKSLKEQELRYKNLALVKGLESEAAKEALETALATRSVLDKLDTNLKNYGRNVGNYKSAFDGLGMSFTQVARELPSLAINAQTFFLAISNNLPMVFDEVSKARKEITALKAAGEETPGLFDRISKSLFSTQVGLSLLVTLLTLFGSKIVESIAGLFDASAALEKYKARVNGLIEAQQKLIDVQRGLKEAYRESINDVDRLDKELKIAQSLGKSRGDILAIELKISKEKRNQADDRYVAEGGFDKEAEGLNKLMDAESEYSAAIERTIKLRREQQYLARFGSTAGIEFDSEGKYDDEIKKSEALETSLEKQLNRRRTTYEYVKKLNKERFDTATDYAVKENEIVTYNREQALIIETESAKNIAQANINKQQRILADDRKFEAARADAIRKSVASRKFILAQELSVIERNPNNRNADGTFTAEAIAARSKYNLDIATLDAEAAVDQFNNAETFRKRRLAAELAINKAEVEYAAARNEEISKSDANSFVKRIDAYGDYFKAQQDLINKDFEYQKATRIMTGEELLQLEAETARKLKELAVKSRKDISDIIVSSNMDELSESTAIDNLKLAKEELALYKSLKNKSKFAKMAAKLERQTAIDSLNNAIFLDKEIVASAKTTEEAKKAAAKRIKENETALAKKQLEEDKEMEADKAARRQINYQIAQKGIETFFSLATILSNNYYQQQYDAIEKERRLMDANYSKEIENIKNSTISQQEKAAQITILEASQSAKRIELMNKENAEKVKQAKLNKAINIAEIIATTALAVVTALKEGDPYTKVGRTILAAATGAAQLAIAIATPIPSYAKGTDNHPGGLARYGEAGSELVQEPGKAPRIATKETISYLRPGTKVTPLTKQSVLDAAGGSMVAAMSDRLRIAEMAEASRSDGRALNEIRDAVYDSARMTAAVLRKQKAPVVTFVNNGRFNEHIENSVRR